MTINILHAKSNRYQPLLFLWSLLSSSARSALSSYQPPARVHGSQAGGGCGSVNGTSSSTTASNSTSTSSSTQTHQLLSTPAAMVSSLRTRRHAHYPPPWFSVAPMMEWTDNHYRTLARLISKNAWLYTEMLAAETIVYQKDNLDRFLEYSPEQHPIVLQIGGNNLENLAKATELAEPYKYDEINFNCGCPSPRVAGHGCFGARLMLDPKFVAEAMSVIAAHTDAPVSVKCRIGVDDHDSYNELCDFIYKVSSQSPTRHFIIHSRKALLNGISPAENRSIPPLKYEYFYGLLRDFPDLRFTINGGINTVDEVNAARRAGAHGVMVGRAAFQKPWHTLGHVDTAIYGAPSSGVTRRQILEKFQVYGDSAVGKYGRKPTVRDVARPLLGLFHSEPGNGVWKRKADAAFLHCTTMKSFFEETLVAIPDHVLDSPIGEPSSGAVLLSRHVRLLAKAAGAAEEQKVKINCDTKKEDKNGSCSAAGIALADGPKPGTPPEKLGKHLLQFVLPCPQLRSVADEAL
ncbi:PREDICTED: tRNA [Prunus dulcis]|uniref:PREDICTED: tRNA n=1 Tax=Prunus dulcis TaxID=3755 RepID=A0A5E4G3V8_PRUDU|nr:PREDICTED: tRNA [Prunus dulcis]